ncbi:MAG: class I SAM-dependent methyltransferase [Chloroflexota bacterium]
MEPEQYEVLFRREDRHWWYSGMRRAALALLRGAAPVSSVARVLDAGCGTGGTTIRMREFGREVFGVDYAAAALAPAASRGLAGRLAQGSVEHLPFQDGSFYLVTSFEVVYHAGVENDCRAFQEFRRVLRPGGLLLLRLPAHDWLRGQHDRLVHTRHRYSREEVRHKLRDVGFRIEHLSWANTVLFLPAAAKRLLERLSRSTGHDEPDLWQPPAPLNWLLEQCVAMEALALPRHLPLPFGLSVIALARA